MEEEKFMSNSADSFMFVIAGEGSNESDGEMKTVRDYCGQIPYCHLYSQERGVVCVFVSLCVSVCVCVCVWGGCFTLILVVPS